MDGERRKAIAAHDDGIFPNHVRSRRDLIERDHPPGDWAPDLQAVDDADIARARRAADGQRSAAAAFPGEDVPCRRSPARDRSRPRRPSKLVSRAWATSTRVMPLRRACNSSKSGRMTFTCSRQSLRTHMAPPSSSRICIAWSPTFAQLGRVGTAKAHLNAAPFARTEQKLLGHGVGVWDAARPGAAGSSAISPSILSPVVDIDQELHEGPVLALRRIDQHEPQSAAADERRDVRHVRLRLNVLLDLVGERLRFRGCACRPAGTHRP